VERHRWPAASISTSSPGNEQRDARKPETTPYRNSALKIFRAMTPKVVDSIPKLLDLLRRRRDELDVPHLTIDAIAGLADGHTSKLLAPNATKGLGHISLPCLLRALALGIVTITVAEDPEQAARLSHRWKKRQRQQRKRSRLPQLGASLAERTDVTLYDSKIKETENEA
jgi:hypothetical protein